MMYSSDNTTTDVPFILHHRRANHESIAQIQGKSRPRTTALVLPEIDDKRQDVKSEEKRDTPSHAKTLKLVFGTGPSPVPSPRLSGKARLSYRDAMTHNDSFT